MTLDNLIDKDRLYFSQFNGDFAVRCPICIDIKKIIRHCKIFRNFHAVWCHVKRDHQDLPQADVNEVIQIFNSLFDAIRRQIIPTTTSSSSGKIDSYFRRDKHEKLIQIANLLKDQSQLYPNYKIKQLMRLIGVVLGPVDERTRRKYLDIVISLSEKNIRNGTINVTEFCNLLIN